MKGVVVTNNQKDLGRKKDLVFNLSYYLEERGGSIDVVGMNEFMDRYREFDFIYAPIMIRDVFDIKGIKFNSPLILDLATSKEAEYSNVFSEYAFRTAFGQTGRSVKCKRPSQVTPLIPPPVRLREDINLTQNRDIICFDIKPFHEVSTVCQVSAIFGRLCEIWDDIIKWLGFEPKIYFTSFFDPEVIFSILRQHKPNVKKPWCLERVIERVIPPAEELQNYKDILNKSCLFVTEHADLADWDVSYCAQIGCRILPYSRGSFGIPRSVNSVILPAWNYLDAEVGEQVNLFKENSVDLRLRPKDIFETLNTAPKFDDQIYRRVYMSSLDIIFGFFQNGYHDSELSRICCSGYKWDKGLNFRKLV